jgi:hypothetical protein
MGLDLNTLKDVRDMFRLHSDHSTRCNGYRQLLRLIEAEENKFYCTDEAMDLGRCDEECDMCKDLP